MRGQSGAHGPRGAPGKEGEPGTGLNVIDLITIRNLQTINYNNHISVRIKGIGIIDKQTLLNLIYNAPKGPPGLPGDPGMPGDTKSRGPHGLKGSKGFPGRNGHAGVQGPAGPHGELGERGPLGPPGSIGNHGLRGQPGNPAPQGSQGKPGVVLLPCSGDPYKPDPIPDPKPDKTPDLKPDPTPDPNLDPQPNPTSEIECCIGENCNSCNGRFCKPCKYNPCDTCCPKNCKTCSGEICPAHCKKICQDIDHVNIKPVDPIIVISSVPPTPAIMPEPIKPIKINICPRVEGLEYIEISDNGICIYFEITKPNLEIDLDRLLYFPRTGGIHRPVLPERPKPITPPPTTTLQIKTTTLSPTTTALPPTTTTNILIPIYVPANPNLCKDNQGNDGITKNDPKLCKTPTENSRPIEIDTVWYTQIPNSETGLRSISIPCLDSNGNDGIISNNPGGCRTPSSNPRYLEVDQTVSVKIPVNINSIPHLSIYTAQVTNPPALYDDICQNSDDMDSANNLQECINRPVDLEELEIDKDLSFEMPSLPEEISTPIKLVEPIKPNIISYTVIPENTIPVGCVEYNINGKKILECRDENDKIFKPLNPDEVSRTELSIFKELICKKDLFNKFINNDDRSAICHKPFFETTDVDNLDDLKYTESYNLDQSGNSEGSDGHRKRRDIQIDNVHICEKDGDFGIDLSKSNLCKQKPKEPKLSKVIEYPELMIENDSDIDEETKVTETVKNIETENVESEEVSEYVLNENDHEPEGESGDRGYVKFVNSTHSNPKKSEEYNSKLVDENIQVLYSKILPGSSFGFLISIVLVEIFMKIYSIVC